MGGFLAEDVDLWNEFLDVVNACDEDLIFNGFGFGLDGSCEGLEAVDYVVAGVC